MLTFFVRFIYLFIYLFDSIFVRDCMFTHVYFLGLHVETFSSNRSVLSALFVPCLCIYDVQLYTDRKLGENPIGSYHILLYAYCSIRLFYLTFPIIFFYLFIYFPKLSLEIKWTETRMSTDNFFKKMFEIEIIKLGILQTTILVWHYGLLTSNLYTILKK